MRLLRTSGAAVVAALAILAVPGAEPAAAQAPAVVVSSPGEGATLGGPSPVSGSAEMMNGGTLTRATVTLASLDGHSSEGATHNYVRGGDGNSGIFSSSDIDNVRFGFTVAPRLNGAYNITAVASGRDPTPDINGEETSPTLVRRFNIEFPPATPSGMSASIDASTKRVTLTWAANSEPDMVGYQVQRAYGSGSYKEIGVAPVAAKPTFSDDLSDSGKFPPGQYRYRAIAIRRARTCANPGTDPACNRGITSGASAYDDVTVRSQTSTTTTTTTVPRPTTTVRRGGGSFEDSWGGSDGGSTGGSSGGSSGAGSSSNSGKSTRGGSVDLSEYSSLLRNSGKTTYIPDREDEGTFGDLQYGERAPDGGEAESDPGVIEIGGKTIGPLKTSDDWVKFLGAGSLATALLVHVLWFKGQVDSFPLESVVPQGE